MASQAKFAEALILQGKQLLSQGKGRPNQADLRRAVSNSYYALFHYMIDGCLGLLIGKSSEPAVKSYFARSFSHTTMKDVFNTLDTTARLPEKFNPIKESLISAHFHVEIRSLARAFIDLQKARHEADYDISYNYSQLDAKDHLKLAEESMKLVDECLKTHPTEMQKLSTLLLLAKVKQG